MIVRLIATATLSSMLLFGSAVAAEQTATPEAVTATEANVSRSDARKIAKEFIKEKGIRGARVGEVSPSGDGYTVVLESLTGIPFRELKIDNTGKLLS